MIPEMSISEKIAYINKLIWGENPCSFYFSFNGTFNRLQFFGALVTLNFFFNFMAAQDILFLTFICGLTVFYATLAAIQKRCRDIGQKGSVCILIFSAAYPATRYLDYVNEQNIFINETMKKILATFIGLYLLVYLFLQFMPGAKEKEMNLSSPLLKHPKIYFAICVTIFCTACLFYALS